MCNHRHGWFFRFLFNVGTLRLNLVMRIFFARIQTLTCTFSSTADQKTQECDD